MLDDEIQRLSELFKRSGDKTGFVRLLDLADIKELFINLVSFTIERFGGKILLKHIHSDSFWPGQSPNELTHQLPHIKKQLENTDYVVCPNATLTYIPSLNEWIFGEAYIKRDLSHHNYILIDKMGHIILTTIISKTDLEIAKEKARVLREELKKLEALGA